MFLSRLAFSGAPGNVVLVMCFHLIRPAFPKPALDDVGSWVSGYGKLLEMLLERWVKHSTIELVEAICILQFIQIS